jgi:hypothetical protein
MNQPQNTPAPQVREVAIYSAQPHPVTQVSYIVGYELQKFEQDPQDGIFKITGKKRVYFAKSPERFNS